MVGRPKLYKVVEWNKTSLGPSYTRRYVQLNCTQVNISYTPFYFYEAESYGALDANKKTDFIEIKDQMEV